MLQYARARRADEFVTFDEMPRPVMQRVKGNIVQRSMRHDADARAMFEVGFERGKDRFVDFA